jgi:hypothetical protein
LCLLPRGRSKSFPILTTAPNRDFVSDFDSKRRFGAVVTSDNILPLYDLGMEDDKRPFVRTQIPPSWLESLERHAESRAVSVTILLRSIIWEWLEGQGGIQNVGASNSSEFGMEA